MPRLVMRGMAVALIVACVVEMVLTIFALDWLTRLMLGDMIYQQYYIIAHWPVWLWLYGRALLGIAVAVLLLQATRAPKT